MNKNIPGAINLRQVLHAHALKLTNGNQHLSQELLHNTIKRIAATAAAYHPGLGFIAWAKMVMENTFDATTPCADVCKLRYLCYHGTITPTTHSHDGTYTTHQQLHTMSRLTPHQAAVVTLRLKGYTPAIIAKQMGNTTNHVKAHIQQATHILNHIWDN